MLTDLADLSPTFLEMRIGFTATFPTKDFFTKTTCHIFILSSIISFTLYHTPAHNITSFQGFEWIKFPLNHYISKQISLKFSWFVMWVSQLTYSRKLIRLILYTLLKGILRVHIALAFTLTFSLTEFWSLFKPRTSVVSYLNLYLLMK